MAQPLVLAILGIATLIIMVLGGYAIHLLLKLRLQKRRQHSIRHQRIKDLLASIQTIAKAMEQQQCNYSEGAIRICRLLASIPVSPRPDFKQRYPAIHTLDTKVQQFATHQARAALPREERERQDQLREEFEVELEVSILKELPALKTLQL